MNQEQLVRIFKALCNENRLKMFQAIRKIQSQYANYSECAEALDVKENSVCCVDKLGEQFEMAPSTISQYLKELHTAGLLERHKRGRWVYYTINLNSVTKLAGFLDRFVAEPGDRGKNFLG